MPLCRSTTGPCTASMKIFLLSACVGSATSDFASTMIKGASKICKAMKVNVTTAAAPMKSVRRSIFLSGRTWQSSVTPSDQALKIPHFAQSPFWNWKWGLPQLWPGFRKNNRYCRVLLIKGSLGGETSVLRTFRMSGKELVKERVSEGKS